MTEDHGNLVSMTRRQFNSHLLQLYGWGPLAITLLLMIPALIAGILSDIRWLIVLFLMICIAAPMVLAFLYIYHGFRPSTASNLAPHTVRIGNDGIGISTFRQTEDSESYEHVSFHTYPYNSIRRLIASGDALTVLLQPPYKGFIWIPVSAFSSEKEALEEFRNISDHVSQKHR